jgi:cytidylate kinase
VVIAIDGPAGAGKSTAARCVAERLHIQYLDTGAMYRAFTYFTLMRQIPVSDKASVAHLLDDFHIRLEGDRCSLNGVDVTRDIRSDAVTELVSYISSLSFVRKKMVELQRDIGNNSDVVAEGRDIGTVVFPETKYKFYLDASIEERAKRRLQDKKSDSDITDIDELINRIRQRDIYDSSREISPLTKAPDAYYIDSTRMSIDEVCDLILSQVKAL